MPGGTGESPDCRAEAAALGRSPLSDRAQTGAQHVEPEVAEIAHALATTGQFLGRRLLERRTRARFGGDLH